MSYYNTSNNSIVRFTVHDPSRKAVAPFSSLARVVQVQSSIGGTGVNESYSTGGSASWLLTPEQLQNGSLIINPATGSNAWILPDAYSLQEYLGGRGAFNMTANLTSQPNTGLNDYFVLNVYNISTIEGYIVSQSPSSGVKTIVASSSAGQAALTPVLIQLDNVNSPYQTIPGTYTANEVTYQVY